MNQDATDALRKFGAEHVLTDEERKSLEAVQITVCDGEPLQIDMRFRRHGYIRTGTWLEVNGKWVNRDSLPVG